MQTYGKLTWLIPDCFLESVSHGKQSHEAVCVINTSPLCAEIKFTLFFEDRAADEGFAASCEPMRTSHIRLDQIKSRDGRLIPRDVPYAILVESNTPIVVQYSRLDTSQPELALMTTMAYAVE